VLNHINGLVLFELYSNPTGQDSRSAIAHWQFTPPRQSQRQLLGHTAATTSSLIAQSTSDFRLLLQIC
jgi:hypothetical protein